MNSDTIEGNWKQLTGEIQKQWGKLTDDHMTQVMGSRKKLAGLIQENYGVAREDADTQVTEWENSRKKSASSGSQRGSL